MSDLEVERGWLEASVHEGKVWLEISATGGWAAVTVEEAIQFSRMIVKAAAEAAGIKEGVSS